MYDDIVDLHTHTIACGHAYNTLYEMAQAAAAKKLALFGSSEHAPAAPGSCTESYFRNYKVIPRRLFGVPTLLGAELNIMDYEGRVDLPDSVLARVDYCIASLHINCLESGSIRENTEACVKALKNPYVAILGHPDDGRYPLDYECLVSHAKQYHKLLEVNNSSLSPVSFRQGAREHYKEMLKLCRRYKQPVILSSDAHIASDVGNHDLAKELLAELDFPPVLVVNSSLEQLAGYLPNISESGFGRTEQ